MSFSTNVARFGKHLEGSSSVAPVRTDGLDAVLFDLRLEHRFEKGLSAGVAVPTGSIRVDPVGGAPAFVTGLGDLELNVAYDLGRLWGLSGGRPSVRVRPMLMLPTGETGQIGEEDGDVPPNLVSIGNGAIGAGLELQASKYVGRSWAVKGWTSLRGPLTYSDTGIRYGTNLGYGIGAAYFATDSIIVDAAARGTHRWHSRERGEGKILSSGGDWWYADVGATMLASKRFAFGVGATVPLYADVNGTQISQSWGVRGFVALTFGLDHEDEHEHGDEHDHGDEHGDEHDHGDDHGAQSEGDVRVLATGGDSFELADAAVPGKIVVIDFWAEWCKPCKVIERDLERLASEHDELVVWRAEVPDLDTPIAKQHLAGAKGLPIVWIFDRSGALVHRLDAVAPERVRETLEPLLESHDAHAH